MKVWWSALMVMVMVAMSMMIGGEAANCGGQAGGKLCAGGECCSQWGWCGTTTAHCGNGCQSQCKSRAVEADAEPAGEKPSAAGHL